MFIALHRLQKELGDTDSDLNLLVINLKKLGDLNASLQIQLIMNKQRKREKNREPRMRTDDSVLFTILKIRKKKKKIMTTSRRILPKGLR